jgi:hypothetical protein
LVLHTYLVYNTVVRLCQFCCCGGKVNVVQIPYSHNCFSKISTTFFVIKLIPYKPTYKKTNSFLLCMDLQPCSHDCFSKNIENFVSFPKQFLLGFFILEKFRTGVSCFSVTLFYSTLLALTVKQNYRQRNEYTRFAWARGTFFPVVLLCQFLVLAGNRFWFYILTYAT